MWCNLGLLCYAAMNLIDNLQVESERSHSFISQTEIFANARQFWGSDKLENVSIQTDVTINMRAKKKIYKNQCSA